MKKYEQPEFQIEKFEIEDVITASATCPTNFVCDSDLGDI